MKPRPSRRRLMALGLAAAGGVVTGCTLGAPAGPVPTVAAPGQVVPGATGIVPSPGEELLLVGLDASRPYWNPGKNKTKVVLVHGAARTTISGLFGVWTNEDRSWSVPQAGYVLALPVGAAARLLIHRRGQDDDLRPADRFDRVRRRERAVRRAGEEPEDQLLGR